MNHASWLYNQPHSFIHSISIIKIIHYTRYSIHSQTLCFLLPGPAPKTSWLNPKWMRSQWVYSLRQKTIHQFVRNEPNEPKQKQKFATNVMKIFAKYNARRGSKKERERERGEKRGQEAKGGNFWLISTVLFLYFVRSSLSCVHVTKGKQS